MIASNGLHDRVKKKNTKGKVSAVDDRSNDENSKHLEEGESGKQLPSTDGMVQYTTKCKLCEQRGHKCFINLKAIKATKGSPACFECNHWRLKCSHAARPKKGEGPDNEQEVAQAPKRRKKPIQVPAGQPGQVSGEAGEEVLYGYISRLTNFFSLGNLGPDILKKAGEL